MKNLSCINSNFLPHPVVYRKVVHTTPLYWALHHDVQVFVVPPSPTVPSTRETSCLLGPGPRHRGSERSQAPEQSHLLRLRFFTCPTHDLSPFAAVQGNFALLAPKAGPASTAALEERFSPEKASQPSLPWPIFLYLFKHRNTPWVRGRYVHLGSFSIKRLVHWAQSRRRVLHGHLRPRRTGWPRLPAPGAARWLLLMVEMLAPARVCWATEVLRHRPSRARQGESENHRITEW